MKNQAPKQQKTKTFFVTLCISLTALLCLLGYWGCDSQECRTDTDCGQQAVCQGGQCKANQAPPQKCQQDSDCPQGKTCQQQACKAPETCEEGKRKPCYSGPNQTLGTGTCTAGISICIVGKWSACTQEILPIPEVCEDKQDNDCDGQVDEDCPTCQDGQTRACYTGPPKTKGEGTCKEGKQTCQNGVWGACSDEVLPTKETCGDKQDNNCNGQIDEDCGVCQDGQTQTCYTGTTETKGVGTCKEGKQTCQNGVWGTCSGEVLPTKEVCGDKQDNDCNGRADEDCGVCQDGQMRACYTGPPNTKNVGMCKEGKQTCQNGAWGTCLADIQPVKEICDDKLDNDCDGQIDEDCLNPPALDLQKVVWLHTNVSQWKQTSNLKSVTFGGGRICLNHTHAQKWPTKKYNGTTDVAANPWVFIYHNKKWYGATWEWMRPGQMCKNITSVAGDHIKRSPFGVKSDGTFWKPKKGQVLYFMVSGLARDTTRNALERTNPVRVTWP